MPKLSPTMEEEQISRWLKKEGDAMTLKDCWVEISLSLNAKVLEFFEADSEKINAILRKEMEKRKLSNELLEDNEFVSRLRENLAA